MRMAVVEFGVALGKKSHSSLNDEYMGRFVFGPLFSVFVCRCVFFIHRLAKQASNIGREPR